LNFKTRHCEERSDEAIQPFSPVLDCFASLAMTMTAGTAALLHSEIPPSQGTILRKSSSAALALA